LKAYVDSGRIEQVVVVPESQTGKAADAANAAAIKLAARQ
jgi:hypothetical protein